MTLSSDIEPEEKDNKPRQMEARKSKEGTAGAGSSSTAPFKRMRKAGKLAKLQEMPLDILFEIFGSLPALDLLRLSHTTKTLRRLLMARSARPTWIQALRAEPDLPPCPTDMTEPAWVRLAFEQACDGCNTVGVRNIFWSLRMRLCNKCVRAGHPDLIMERRITYTDDIANMEIRCVVSWDTTRHTTYYKRKEYEDVLATVTSFEIGSPEREEYLKQRKEMMAASREHVQLCEKWHNEHQDQRASDLDAARERRKNAIKQKLREAGYGREVNWLGTAVALRTTDWEFSNLKAVKQPRDLTPRIWNNIKTEMFEYMESIRGNCEVDTRYTTLQGRISSLVLSLEAHELPPVFVPRVIDLYALGPIRDLIDAPLADDGEDTVTIANFETVLQDWDTILASSREHQKMRLLDALKEYRGLRERPGEDVLQLATSVFKCLDCSHSPWKVRVMSAAQALRHRCGSAHSGYDPSDHWAIKDDRKRVELVCQWVEGAGGAGKLDVHPQAEVRVARVVELARLDKERTTVEDMDDKERWFVCRCPDCLRQTPLGTKTALDWRQAVEHQVAAKYLYRLNGEEENAATDIRADQELELPTSGTNAHRMIWECMHGAAPVMAAGPLRVYLRNVHGVTDVPQYGRDFMLAEDAVFAKPWPPVLLKMDEILPVRAADEDDSYDEDSYDEDDVYTSGMYAFIVGMFGLGLVGGSDDDDDCDSN